MVTTPIGTSDDAGRKALVQADGKIVVAGYSVGSTTGHDFAVVRYNLDGSLDTTFGGTGKVTTDLGSADEGGWSAALQSDGKIVVVGRRFNGTTDDIVLIRYNTNGTLDSSFGIGGRVIYDEGAYEQALGVTIKPDGEIIVVGSSNLFGDTDVFSVRFNSSGTLINSEGFDYYGLTDVGNSVAIQSDGKYLVAGYATYIDGFKYITLIRYNADGSPDATFESAGAVITAVGVADDVAQSVLVQPNGKIIVTGYTVDDVTGQNLLVLRYNANGTLDTTFGLSGVTSTDLGSLDEGAWGAALQVDGKIIVVGRRFNGSTDDLVLIRYNSNGSIDTTFGSSGSVITPAGSGVGSGWSVALQSDGRIVVTGSSSNVPNQDIITLRFNTNGTIDNTFGGQAAGSPIITSNGGGATASVSVSENSTAVTTVAATDPDVGQTPVYSISGGADLARFTINSSTGALSFINAPNFEAPTDANTDNVYEVIVEASDGAITDTQTISVAVTDQNEAPSITSSGGGATTLVSVSTNSTAVGTVTASDPDANTTLTYSMSGGADLARFSINSSTGALSFINAPNFEAPTDANTDNVYKVIVQASDGTLTDLQTISVTVTTQTGAPSITSDGAGATASISFAENGIAVTTVAATDPDAGQTPGYSISGGSDRARFSINSSTGALSFVNAPNFEAPTDTNTDNVYEVIVQASDGTLTDTQTISVTVTNQNEAPSITSNGGGATASVSISENSTAVTTLAATDSDDGQTLLYSISGGADLARFTIDSSTGALSFINAPNFEAPTDANTDNVYEVIVQASDGTLTDVQTISVTVTDHDNEPVLATNGDDILIAVTAPDAFNGVLGSDTVSYINATSGVTANLTNPAVNKGFAQGDTYISIENLTGSSFNDTLTGDANANVLTGGAGVDKLVGGTGNDTYYVNLTAAAKLEDKVTETSKIASEVDRIVLSGISINAAVATLKLAANIEDIDASATGSSLLNLTGSALSNTIIGNAAANVITGGALGDTMDGRDGGDRYVVASAADFNGDTINDTGTSGVDEFRFTGKAAATLNLNAVGLEQVVIGTGTGTNAVTTGKGAINIDASGVANALTMIGNNGANALTGTGFNDVLQGNSGNDNLNGGAGNDALYGGLDNDILTGGSGMDSFVFNTTPNATKNWDTITDFNVADDTMQLENAIFTALGVAPGILSAGALVIGTAALDAANRIVYNSDTGALFYDSDGNAQGGAVQIATLGMGLLLTNDDFLII